MTGVLLVLVLAQDVLVSILKIFAEKDVTPQELAMRTTAIDVVNK